MSAAAINPDFAKLLVNDPVAAIELIESDLQLSSTERDLVLSIQGAADIHDFALRLHHQIQLSHDHSG